ncbi:MAG: S8 family serine peptidase [Methylorubrum populi]
MAGNHANHAYGSTFKPAATPTTIDGETVQLHEFAPGQDYIAITIPARTNIPFTFQWSDAYASVSPSNGAKTDLDLFFFNDRNEFLFKVSNPNIGNDPIEQIAYFAGDTDETIHVKVGLVEGPPPDEFRLIALTNGNWAYFEPLASNLNSGTLYGHAAARDALSVGAVNYRDTPAFGASQPWAEAFSSVGRASFTHDVHGNRLPLPDIRSGPAFMAPNDGDNTFFGWDSDGNGLPNFSGTSAAAPHAAALAALMLQANPALTSVDVRNLLQNSAIDMDDLNTPGFDKGYDSATGAGLIQGTALGFAATGVIDNPFRKSLLLGTHLDDHIIGWGAREEAAGGSGTSPAGATVDVALYGYAGNDRLEGGAGNDLLDGGSGRDRMSGGGGNDRYVVDDPADVVVEKAGAGIDTVLASVSYTLPAHVENLTLTGSAALSAFGNGQDNVLTGNDAANLIVGGGGNDTLVGGGGDDTLVGGEGDDRIFGGAGDDRIHANGGDNYIDAGAGNDLITTGNGDDVIVGGAGDDTIYANGGRNLFQLGGVLGTASDGNDQIWAGNGGDTYALFFEDAEGGAAGFGHDTINGFRLAEGDQLLLFNETAGYWDDANTLSALIDGGQVRGMRSADGGDLTLTFAGGQAAQSALTLKWFFWDNAGSLSKSERGTAFGAEIRTADLTGILLDTIQDGASLGISGPDYLTAAHQFMASGHALV